MYTFHQYILFDHLNIGDQFLVWKNDRLYALVKTGEKEFTFRDEPAINYPAESNWLVETK